MNPNISVCSCPASHVYSNPRPQRRSLLGFHIAYCALIWDNRLSPLPPMVKHTSRGHKLWVPLPHTAMWHSTRRRRKYSNTHAATSPPQALVRISHHGRPMFYSLSLKLTFNVNFFSQKEGEVMDGCAMTFVGVKRECAEVTLVNLINSTGARRR